MASSPKVSPILFVNYGVQNCGVYQYGASVLEAIREIEGFTFDSVDVLNLEELDAAVKGKPYTAIVYNYHPHTMTFLKPDMPRRYPCPNIAIMHEMTQSEADGMASGFFQHFVMGDPTLVETNPGVFKTGRLVPEYPTTAFVAPEVPVIGSYGFPVGSKGFPKLVERVQTEFDRAKIRLHIPPNGIMDKDGELARKVAAECKALIRKPGIEIETSHDFKDRRGLLDFLAGNTVNAFHYDYLPIAGVSSSTDLALAVNRPIAITKSIMFRHLWSVRPTITFEDSSLKEVIRNGIEPIDHLRRLWNKENLRREYAAIFEKVLNPKSVAEFTARPAPTTSKALNDYPDFDYKTLTRKYNSLISVFRRMYHRSRMNSALKDRAKFESKHAVSVKRLNRVLDNQAREQYQSTVEQLWALAPEIMVSKIPAANVQQAFVFDTVRRVLSETDRTTRKVRMLSVGSFDDSASTGLKKLGYPMDEIDPVVNGLDLAKFMKLPTTKPASYKIVLSTSVIEHVKEDEEFLTDIATLLEPGGVAVLTCDFHNTHPKDGAIIPGDHRWYSERDLLTRVTPLLEKHGCALVDVPQWGCNVPDFKFVGYQYTFASLVFRKKGHKATDNESVGLVSAERPSVDNRYGTSSN